MTMKKVEVETECGEVSVIYVSQDVTKITIDGEEYGVQKPSVDKRLPVVDYMLITSLLERILEGIASYTEVNELICTGDWIVKYIIKDNKLTIDFTGTAGLQGAIFQLS